jgi:glyoxylase I family protein
LNSEGILNSKIENPMTLSPAIKPTFLTSGSLRKVHHIALNVKDMKISRYFYGTVLGLHELTGQEVPLTLKQLVAAGKVANFITPDGTILDLFWEPELSPPNPDPKQAFTRANHLAFDIDPQRFDHAVEVLIQNQIVIDSGPVSRPTGRGIYFYDPDGFLLEIRCDPILQ